MAELAPIAPVPCPSCGGLQFGYIVCTLCGYIAPYPLLQDDTDRLGDVMDKPLTGVSAWIYSTAYTCWTIHGRECLIWLSPRPPY